MSEHFHAPIAEQIWDKKYRLRDENKQPIEADVTDTWHRIAKALAQAEKPESRVRHEADFYWALEGFKFLPAGRIIAGAGTDRNVTLFNCFVMGTIPDDMGGIFSALREAALTMQQGGGIGYDFSPLRPKGSLVRGVAADASGPLTFMDVWDSMCRTVMSAGSRRGAMMATMRVDHPDIEYFITAKHDARRLRMFNLSVLITDAFMEAVKNDELFQLVHKQPPGKTGGQYDDMVIRLDTGTGEDFYVYRTVNARELWDKIMKNTYDHAEPGVIFIDRVNEANNLKYMEKISSTNPCAEQPLPPYGACLLGSINLPTIVTNAFQKNARIEVGMLRQVVSIAIRMMDNVVDVSKFPLPEQEAEAKVKRRLGMGVTGLADALIMCGLTYGSEEAVLMTERWMQAIDDAAYDTSIHLAREKGSFPGFDVDGFLAEGTHASTKSRKIQDDIRLYGIRNSHLTSIAPTGTISLYAGNVSSGIEPVFAYTYTRKVLNDDGTKRQESVEDYAYAAYRDYCNDTDNLDQADRGLVFDSHFMPTYFVSAQTLEPMAHIKMQAAVQKYVDSSISKTINCPEDISFEEFCGVYMAAWDSGCKGCTTYRPNDVTGSVLSVPVAPAVTKGAMPFTIDILKEQAKRWLALNDLNFEGLRIWLDERKIRSVSKVPEKLWPELLKLIGKPEEHLILTEDAETLVEDEIFSKVSETPTSRPDELDGATYKLKWPGSEHALYITINDVIGDDLKIRPFEVFINSKNMEHFAWTVALTRMISGVFRKGGDVTFVVEELKAVFDPKGGAWLNGKFIPSVLAAIGGVIEKHMKAIGYIAGVDKNNVSDVDKNNVSDVVASEDLRPGDALEIFGLNDRAVKKADTSPYRLTAQEITDGFSQVAKVWSQRQAPITCAACFSSNVKKESGCFVCKDCGNSICG